VDIPAPGQTFVMFSSRVTNSDGKMIPVDVDHLQRIILTDFHNSETGQDVVKTQWHGTWSTNDRPGTSGTMGERESISCTDREYIDAAFDILAHQLEVIEPPQGNSPATTTTTKGKALQRLQSTELAET
jgi:hypothetical protein